MQKADETQILLKRTAEKIVEIGKNLLEVKERLPHGMFGVWLQSEFGMSHRTASKFMSVAERFYGKLEPGSNLPASALYLLASPSVPNEVVDEAIQRASAGEKITKALVQQIIDAQEAIKEAQDAEAKAKADLLLQEELFCKAEVDLNKQIEDLDVRTSTRQCYILCSVTQELAGKETRQS